MSTWLNLYNNPDLKNNIFLRENIIHAIRDFFLIKKFHEIETPLLVPAVIPESYLESFSTDLIDRKRNKNGMFLTTSPEASLKKLLVANIGNCFEITKGFRNGETDSLLHSPEFTILEWYRVNATYQEIMRDCEGLIIYILHKINYARIKDLKNSRIIYQGKTIDLTPPWKRISVPAALQKYAGISFDEITNKKGEMFPKALIAEVAKKKGYQIESKNSWEEIFNQIFLNEIEPHLGMNGKPTIIYDYPTPMAGLAKIKESDTRLTERFELYIGGLELGDCYTELTDYKEQKNRFLEEIRKIRLLKKTKIVPDLDFISALKHGLPECSGMAIGIDRIVMLFTNTKNILDTKFSYS